MSNFDLPIVDGRPLAQSDIEALKANRMWKHMSEFYAQQTHLLMSPRIESKELSRDVERFDAGQLKACIDIFSMPERMLGFMKERVNE